ncbi:MAG: carbohydrate ABC transporter permease [Spirochaetales bacterium]
MRKPLRSFFWYLTASLVAAFVLLPFFWMLSTSFKARGALMALPVQWLPEKPSWDGYLKVFELIPFTRALLNTLFVAICTMTLTVFSSAMAAFGFAKLKFRGREAVFALYLAALMIPMQVTTIPLFILLSKLSLIGTWQGLLLPSLFNAFGIFLLRQQFATIPEDYLDAARLDGASTWRTFTRVILPLGQVTLVSLAVIVFLGAWNDYFWPLVILTDPEKMTLSLALNQLNGQYSTRFNVLMAGSLLSMLPILGVYAFAQKYFQSGLQTGGLKG